MWNSCTIVFPNTYAWEQNIKNEKHKETLEEGKKRCVSMKEAKRARKERN